MDKHLRVWDYPDDVKHVSVDGFEEDLNYGFDATVQALWEDRSNDGERCGCGDFVATELVSFDPSSMLGGMCEHLFEQGS